MSSVPSKIFKWYTKSTFFSFYLFYIFFHIWIYFFNNFDDDRFLMVRINIWKMLIQHALEFISVIKFGWSKLSIWGDQLWNPITTKHRLILSFFFFSTWFNTLYTTTFIFTNLDFIHTRICYGFLNENKHQEYSILLVIYISKVMRFILANLLVD
jgi:hypothetical protein